MSTDTRATDSAFVERLLAGIETHLDEETDAPFSGVSVRESASDGRAIVVSGGRYGDLVVSAVPETLGPAHPDAIERARDAAETAGVVATCDGADLLLFDVRDGTGEHEIDYYLDLRDRGLRDAVESLLDVVGHLEREGEFPEQSARTRLHRALRSALDRSTRALEAAARDACDSDPEFAATVDEWVESTEAGNRDRALEIAATRRAISLLQRFLSGTGGGTQRGEDEGTAGTASVDDRLRDATAAIGRETVRESTDAAPLDRFPDGESTRRDLVPAFAIADRAPPATGLEYLLGRAYEEHIPERDRSARGQFYTPEPIAEALVRWALGADASGDEDRPPNVLDPAAGTGIFTVEAYRALAERYPEIPRDELLDRIHAVDVERFPLRLTASILAGDDADGGTAPVNAYRGSFFDLEPSTDVSADDRIDALGAGESGEIGRVDAVVGNPPYVEASELAPDADHFRAHLRDFGPNDAAPYADGEDAIGRNADAYVYFVTQATRFLRDGGRLAFVVPTKWMMSRYGAQFQGFLHDHYRIEAIVGFDARAFEDALVDASLLLLERCDDGRKRRDNVVRFVQLGDAASQETVREAIARDVGERGEDGPPATDPAIERRESLRVVAVEQSSLADGTDHGKIAHYLVAPEELVALVESPELTALGDLADVSRGAMTGSTAFFFPDEDDVDAHGIEDKFLRPALKSMRGHDAIACDAADVDRRFVDVHEYVESVRRRADGCEQDESLETRVKRALADDGYDGLRSWIRRAEAADEHRGATCERREVWFDAGEPPRPEILFQKLLRERLFSIYNRASAVPSNAVDCVDVHDDVDSKALFGVLNSSVARAIMEAWGRNEAGMLQLMTYETASLPVPDVRAMSPEERAEIAAVVDDVLDRGTSDLNDDDRDRLDAAVLATLDSVETSPERIRRIQRFMLERRVSSGASAEVLLDD